MKTIKITHTGIIPGQIQLLVKNASATDVQIPLSPGDFVYAENDMETNSIIVYRRKKIIDVKEEEKPTHLGFYTIYGPHTDMSIQKEAPSTAVYEVVPEILLEEQKVVKKGKKRGRHKKRGPKKGSKNKKEPVLFETDSEGHVISITGIIQNAPESTKNRPY